MSLDTLFALCRRIDLLSLECRVQMHDAGFMDEQAGNLLHGSLGLAMKEAAPRLWQDAFLNCFYNFRIFSCRGSHGKSKCDPSIIFSSILCCV